MVRSVTMRYSTVTFVVERNSVKSSVMSGCSAARLRLRIIWVRTHRQRRYRRFWCRRQSARQSRCRGQCANRTGRRCEFAWLILHTGRKGVSEQVTYSERYMKNGGGRPSAPPLGMRYWLREENSAHGFALSVCKVRIPVFGL